MTESIENNEPLPSETQVRQAIEKILEDRAYEEVRRLEDEVGATLIEFQGSDEAGDRMDIFYKRSGSYDDQKNIAPSTSIEVVYYIGDVPCGGDVKADFVDGKWVWR